MPTRTPKIGFVLIGGPHQLLHIVPVAVALRAMGQAAVRLFTTDHRQERMLRQRFPELAHSGVIFHRLTPGPLLSLLGRIVPKWKALKLPRLLRHRQAFSGLDVIVTAERTSTILKSLVNPSPKLVHIPHGAGDRAQGFEPRLARFDHVITAGEKDRQRMIAAGLLDPDHVSVSGYVKLDWVKHHPTPSPFRFAQNRPVILYNPHFDADLTSWGQLGRDFIAQLVALERFNLVVAPHVRLYNGAIDQTLRTEIPALFDRPDAVLFDPGSDRSIDMSYTRHADIYVGDVSSQVYEFLSTPKPCVFLNAHDAVWRGNPDYHHWTFGKVARTAGDAVAAVIAAHGEHPGYTAQQQQGVTHAFGPVDGAAQNAADIIVRVARGEGVGSEPIKFDRVSTGA